MGRTPRRLPPRTSCTGPVSTCFVPGLPRHPADTLALDQRPRGPGGQAEALGCGARRASQARPTPRRPSRETRCRQATTPPADTGHVDRLCPTGVAATPSHSGVQRGVDSAAAAPRTPEVVRPDTCMHPSGHLDALDGWTPDAWTLDVRSTGWTDIPTAGPGSRTGQRPAWPASGHPGARCPPAGRPTSPGHGTWGRSATHDGSAVTDTSAAALTAATGQLPQHRPV
jgi:hypothetical protein